MTKDMESLRTILRDMGWPVATDSLLKELCSPEEIETMKNNGQLKIWNNKCTESENAYFIDFQKTTYPHASSIILDMCSQIREMADCNHALNESAAMIKNLDLLIDEAKKAQTKLYKTYKDATENLISK